MTPETAQSLATDALNSLVEAIAQGHSAALTTYLKTLSKFHNYSLGNQLLIAWQRPTASRIAGFNTWKRMGRFVKKGEKGIAILAPMKFKGHAKESEDNTEEAQVYMRFRTATVFDVSQTDGQPLPELGTTEGDPGPYLERLKAFIASRNTTLEYTDAIRPALGTSSVGMIRIALGLTPSEEFAVLSHELAHDILHHGSDRPASLTVRETEAEATAFAVCHHVGLDTGTASHDYIALYNGDKQAFTASLTTIRNTAASIIAALEAPPAEPSPA